MDRFKFVDEETIYECTQCGTDVALDEAYYSDSHLTFCDVECATEYLIENAEFYVDKVFGG